MDDLFARFVEEKRYPAYLSPTTVIFYQNSYSDLKKTAGEHLRTRARLP